MAGADVRVVLEYKRSEYFKLPDPNAPSWTTRADAQGGYRVRELPEGQYAIVAMKGDAYGIGSFGVNPRETEDEYVEVTIRPVGSIGSAAYDTSLHTATAVVNVADGRDQTVTLSLN